MTFYTKFQLKIVLDFISWREAIQHLLSLLLSLILIHTIHRPFLTTQKTCNAFKIKKYSTINLRESILIITRTITSIRYAKENDREKREIRKERERKVEGEIKRGRER